MEVKLSGITTRPPGSRPSPASTLSICAGSRTGAGLSVILKDAAMASNGRKQNNQPPGAVSGSNMTAKVLVAGAISFSNSTHLPPIEDGLLANPVALPPGRPRLATKPSLTGSAADTNTTGIVLVSRNTAPTTKLLPA